ELTTAWGEPLPNVSLPRAVADRYGFTQREKDSESGLLHFRARSYDPRLGRFVQNDPVRGNRPSKHYSYASNRPTGNIDPLGLDDEEKWEWLSWQPYVKRIRVHILRPIERWGANTGNVPIAAVTGFIGGLGEGAENITTAVNNTVKGTRTAVFNP